MSRVDTDPSTSRTEAGDLFDLQFAPLSFDTVICDPPFAYYSRMDWVQNLARISRKRLLISPDRTIIRVNRTHWNTRLFAMQLTESAMYLRLYYCFDRINRRLEPPKDEYE